MHNVVHLLCGVGVLVARTSRAPLLYLLIGIVYLLLWVYGLVIGHDSADSVVPLNTADNWLHLFLSVAMAGPSGDFRGLVPRENALMHVR